MATTAQCTRKRPHLGVRLVETIIFTALERRASDIHIEARDSKSPSNTYRWRVATAMQPSPRSGIPRSLGIKVLSELDIAERRVPRTGASA